jgi:hypothetical protein
MGFFSKIKNYVTGGAAEVQITFESKIVDGSNPLRLFVTATANDDCNIKKVYLKIRAKETYTEYVTRHNSNSNGGNTSTRELVTKTHDHLKQEFTLVNEIKLTKGQSEKWLSEFTFPPNSIATYHGKQASFKWEAIAGLDMAGNDPDSSWQEFILQKNMNHTNSIIGNGTI